MKFQQQSGKEFEKSEKERTVEEEIYIEEEWKQIKEVNSRSSRTNNRIPTKTTWERMVS